MSLTIIAYHYVRDIRGSRYSGIKGLEFSRFKRQMSYVDAHYTIVGVEDVIEAINGGKALPEDAALLTFDDGYIDHYTCVFPVLHSMGVQGSFYINGKAFAEHRLLDVNKIHFTLAAAEAGGGIAQLVEELRSLMDHYRGTEFSYPSNAELWDEYARPTGYDPAEVIFVKRMLQTALPEELRLIISSRLFSEYVGVDEEAFARELYVRPEHLSTMRSCGMYIGVHGYDHYWLGRLPREQMEADITRALEVLSPYIDSSLWAMNYPYGLPGAWNDDVLAFIAKKGCAVGFTVEPRVADIANENRFLLPRIDTNEIPID